MMHYSKNSKLTVSPDKQTPTSFLHLALPVMDEPDLLNRLLDCLSNQSYKRYRLIVCVNQPDAWWDDAAKITACRNNAATLKLLNSRKGMDITILDHSSKGRGWTGKRIGVGYARKILMEHINHEARPEDVIVSLDADAVFSKNYLASIANNLSSHPDAVALSLPYFHRTTDDSKVSRAILRYEIYMRHYFLNLARIGSPYAFTALGSAMALPVWAYRAIGGMTPKLSGEDFYFLQKLRKFGHLLLWNDETVYPEARFSDRVFFGTGPAMIKGAAGDWSSYPVYPSVLFDKILETYLLLPVFYFQSPDTVIGRFISEIFKESDPFQPLRSNHRDLDHFIRAFHEKFDGLRILQFLKMQHDELHSSDEASLHEFLYRFYPATELNKMKINWEKFSFESSPVRELEKIRTFLFHKEMGVRSTSALL